MSLAELLRTHSSAEITEWMAYERVTGIFGPERQDILHGIQTAVIANANRSKGTRKAEAKDFIPVWDQGKRGPMSWQDMLAAAKAYTSRVGGTDHTTKGGAAGGDA
ncbi:phage tail assembly protein T [Streptomyces ardesiacus]|uniref:Minor tail T domain-containing protein n=1 Tax=Streptomyces ardesiacus TaxID=285564 RepID=A0ABW8H796_9ACTN